MVLRGASGLQLRLGECSAEGAEGGAAVHDSNSAVGEAAADCVGPSDAHCQGVCCYVRVVVVAVLVVVDINILIKMVLYQIIIRYPISYLHCFRLCPSPHSKSLPIHIAIVKTFPVFC